MTIYVDNAYIKAKVGRYESRWCHLLSDNPNPEELHQFAEKLGLKRSYFQSASSWWHQHYDVTLGVRAKAVKLGAVEIDIYDWMEIVANRRAD